MKLNPQSRTAAKAQTPAISAQAPMKAFNPQSAKLTLIGYRAKPDRPWIPNSRTRSKLYLKAETALDLIEAAAHARLIGLPFNLSLCIHFDAGNLKPHYTAQDAIHYFRKPAMEWLAKRGIPATFIWVLEHDIGNGRPNGTGLHVHILLHCPEQHQDDFIEMAKQNWLVSAGMNMRDPSTLVPKPIKPYDYKIAEKGERQAYFDNYKTALAYLLKGMDPNEPLRKVTGDNRPFAEWLGIADTLKANLPIFGRRASKSQNITKGARDRYHAELSVK